MNQNELYHHGIKGQRWGVRRTPEQLGYDKKDSSVTKRVKKLKSKNQNDTKQTKEITPKEKYNEQLKRIRNIAKVGAGAEMVGIVMKSIGQRMYDDNKLNSTVGKTAVINILGYGGDISEVVGKSMLVGAGSANLAAYDKYRKDSIKKIYKK